MKPRPRVRVERVSDGSWEAWVPGYLLDDGTTAEDTYPTHEEAMRCGVPRIMALIDAGWLHPR